MSPKFIIRYLSGCNDKLRELSGRGEGNLAYLWLDFLWVSIVHGAIINHYTRGNLYRFKGCERRKSLTYRRILKAFSGMNEPDSIRILNNKHLFNAHFSPFVKRRWLYSREMTFDDFNMLCDNCDMLIVKPEDGVEGNGIAKCPPLSELATANVSMMNWQRDIS